MTTNHSPASTEGAVPVAIAAQGSFAVGGTIVSRDGSFDARNPVDPSGQTPHGDHAPS